MTALTGKAVAGRADRREQRASRPHVGVQVSHVVAACMDGKQRLPAPKAAWLSSYAKFRAEAIKLEGAWLRLKSDTSRLV